jgi:pimeloyl-ACP methyl ester carboxylesterase
MAAFRWIEGVGGEVIAEGKRLEAVAHGPSPRQAPAVVMLHEGLGCVALWRDFPARLAAAAGLGVFAYSRAGYGQSDPVDLPRPLDYMTREARLSLPAVLKAIRLERGILLGHSDGASIAAIYAGEHSDERINGLILMAPHLFAEEGGLASIAEARRSYKTGELRARLAKYHAHVDNAFLGLERCMARSRVQGLEHRGCGRALARPYASHPGRGRPVRDAPADPRDRGAIARAGDEPHSRTLPPFAADRSAAGDARRDRPLLRRGPVTGALRPLEANGAGASKRK